MGEGISGMVTTFMKGHDRSGAGAVEILQTVTWGGTLEKVTPNYL